jgi:hypothetical protein
MVDQDVYDDPNAGAATVTIPDPSAHPGPWSVAVTTKITS